MISFPVLIVAGGWFLNSFYKADPANQSAILALIGVVGAEIIAHLSAKKREIEARHFSDKRAGYTAFISLLLSTFTAVKAGKNIPQKELNKKMMEFKQILLIWSDAEVISTWDEFENNLINPPADPADALLPMGRIIMSMRKDLGKDDSQLTDGDLVSLLLIPEDKHIVKGKQWSPKTF